MLTIGSLFSGVGGLELGLEWAGLGPVRWQVERDAFRRAVLARHWPTVDRRITDVRKAGAATLCSVDLICGGFPCQDVSSAGRGAGLSGLRSGLWWEFRRVLDELRPPYVIVENVESGAYRWLCAVRRSLHELGYRTTALGISAADVGAPHLRRRIFVVGDAHGERGREPHEEAAAERAGRAWSRADPRGRPRQPPEPQVGGSPDGVSARMDRGAGVAVRPVTRWPAGMGQPPFPWEPPRAARGVPQQVERLAALGDAVMPACARAAGEWLLAHAPGPGVLPASVEARA